MVENSSPLLLIKHLSKKVQSGDSEILILKDINLNIYKADTIAILGTSGSGKTTLLNLLAGLDLPSSGDIFFKNHHINQLNQEQRTILRAQYMGFIFQSFLLLPTLTALENVSLALEIQYTPYKKAKNEALFWLTKVGLADRLHHYPKQLSGGEQQRVAIARAFVNQRQIIFADEMTGNLDNKTGRLISDLLFSLNKESATTLVLVTHDAFLAKRCQRQFYLQDGKLISC